ncbi:MAG: hypothetical protein ACI9MR_003459 [Myxococcota bacterium]|jgi:hypothetical protein
MPGKVVEPQTPTSVTIDGIDGSSFSISGTRSRWSMVFTTWRCGERDIFLVVGLEQTDARTLHDRVLATVKCDATATLQPPLMPIVTPPAGWAQIRTGENLTFTTVDGGLVF